MTVNKLPPSTARLATEKIAHKLVEQQLVTQTELDALLKNPVITAEERSAATTLIGHMRARIEAFGKGKLRTVAQFENAIAAEASASARIDAARKALDAGVINRFAFVGLSGVKVNDETAIAFLRSTITTKAELSRLEGVLAGASAEQQPELEAKIAGIKAKLDVMKPLADTLGHVRVDGSMTDMNRLLIVTGVLVGLLFGVDIAREQLPQLVDASGVAILGFKMLMHAIGGGCVGDFAYERLMKPLDQDAV
jgi:hypothetical protein